MAHNKTVQSNRQSGFALLMSLIVVGVLISIGLTVLELSIKQVQLSTNARDSEIAFHAANAGMECARYWRRAASSTMESGGTLNTNCFGVAASDAPTVISSGVTGFDGVAAPSGAVLLYEYSFTWGDAGDRCTEVTNLVASSTLPNGLKIFNMPTHIPGFTSASTTCEAGARCSVISVRGYNKPCTGVNNFGTVQREVLLQF